MNVEAVRPVEHSLGPYRAWLTGQVRRAVVLGALTGVLWCGWGGLVGSLLGLHSRGLTVVWTLDLERAAWRGALLGLLIGRFGRPGRSTWPLMALSAVALVVYDWWVLSSHFIPLPKAFSLEVTLHYVVNASVICGTIGLLLRMTERGRVAESMTSGQQGPALAAEAAEPRQPA